MSDPTGPIPKRFWWLKRLALLALLLVAGVVLLHVVWASRVEARLQNTVADIQAKGEPILFVDLSYPSLSDPENGAWYLNNAEAIWPGVPGSIADVLDDQWYTDDYETYNDPITDNAAYLASCKTSLDLVRAAAACEDADWGVVLSQPVFNTALQHLSSMRQLARLMEDAARRAVEAGDTELALDIMLHIQTVARLTQARPMGIITHLVGASIAELNVELIERQLPKLDPAALREGPPRDKALALIAAITDNPLRDSLLESMVSERFFIFDCFESVIDGRMTLGSLGAGSTLDTMLATPGLRQAVLPFLIDEQQRVTQAMTDTIQAMRSHTQYHPMSDAAAQAFAPIEYSYETSMMSWMLLGTFKPYITSHHQSLARQRMAATAIAIRLFEVDHGERPKTLDQLMPAYLPALPTDPFSKAGEPIRYNPAGVVPELEEYEADRLTDEQAAELDSHPYAVLYSLGVDGFDNAGAPLHMKATGELDDYNNRSYDDSERTDIWFSLDGRPEPVFKENELISPYDVYDDEQDFNDEQTPDTEPAADDPTAADVASEPADDEVDVDQDAGQDNQANQGQDKPEHEQ